MRAHDDIADRRRQRLLHLNAAILAGMERKLLEEERVALGLGKDRLGQDFRQACLTDHRIEHPLAILPHQRMQRDLRGIGFCRARAADSPGDR